jgi:hypothetical protein
MTYKAAIEKAARELRKRDPAALAASAEVAYDGRNLLIPFLHRRYAVRFPEIEVIALDRGPQPSETDWVILLHYLVTADGSPIAGHWVAFRDLDGGYVFEAAFLRTACEPLAEAFGSDLAGFRRGAVAIGGRRMDRTGDAAFWFQPLPRILMACILFAADEEMPASANIVFDAAANHYLPTEDLAALGGYLARLLVEKREMQAQAPQA